MSNERQSMRITLTTASLVRIIVVLLLLYFAYLIKDILAILFIALVFSSAIDPWIDWMQKYKIPRPLGITLIYLAMLAVLAGAVLLIIPPIVQQSSQLVSDLPNYIERFNSYLSNFRDYTASHGWLDNIKNTVGNSASNLQSAAGNVFTTIFGFFGGILSLVVVLVITFYMVVQESIIRKAIWSLTPADKQDYVMDVFKRMQQKMGLWFRGQLILCLAIFILTYAGLLAIGVKYALILALIAGLTEFIPYLGPLLGAIPAVFLASTQSPTLGLITAILYFVIQIVENNLLVPKIMQKAVGLNPIVSIVAIMIGFSVGGVVGALLSIPVATAGSVLVEDLLHKKHAMSMKAMEEDK